MTETVIRPTSVFQELDCDGIGLTQLTQEARVVALTSNFCDVLIFRKLFGELAAAKVGRPRFAKFWRYDVMTFDDL